MPAETAAVFLYCLETHTASEAPDGGAHVAIINDAHKELWQRLAPGVPGPYD